MTKELIAQVEYWKHRCKLAENVIKESPCDPDITAAQMEAYTKYKLFLAGQPIPQEGEKTYDPFVRKHLSRIKLGLASVGASSVFIPCMPQDEGAFNLPNTNTWLREIKFDSIEAPQEGAQEGDGTIIQFLLGSHSFRGKWFGDKTEGEPPFWWRSILRAYREGGFKYDMPAPTYPAEFVEWACDNYDHRKTGWYSWDDVDSETSFPFIIKEGAKVYTTAELYKEWKRIKDQ